MKLTVRIVACRKHNRAHYTDSKIGCQLTSAKNDSAIDNNNTGYYF